MTPTGVPFAKGHGTGNDFVILDGLAGGPSVTPAVVVALCDRRRGLGGDGVLVVARTSDHPEVADQSADSEFFMDYRNADGSLAQMCGNGARVFAAHLVDRGLVPSGRFTIATRGGPREVHVPADGGAIVVDMGHPSFLDDVDVRVSAGSSSAGQEAVGVLMPNPHAVTWVDDVAQAGPLLHAPAVTPGWAFPEGVNVEFVQVVGADHVRMRVFERGVGETLSCGTGACAAAVASLRLRGKAPGATSVRVDVPGGSLNVRWQGDGAVLLGGPAVIVARGWIAQEWWDAHA